MLSYHHFSRWTLKESNSCPTASMAPYYPFSQSTLEASSSYSTASMAPRYPSTQRVLKASSSRPTSSMVPDYHFYQGALRASSSPPTIFMPPIYPLFQSAPGAPIYTASCANRQPSQTLTTRGRPRSDRYRSFLTDRPRRGFAPLSVDSLKRKRAVWAKDEITLSQRKKRVREFFFNAPFRVGGGEEEKAGSL